MWERNSCRGRGKERLPKEEELPQRMRTQVDTSNLSPNSADTELPQAKACGVSWTTLLLPQFISNLKDGAFLLIHQ